MYMPSKLQNILEVLTFPLNCSHERTSKNLELDNKLHMSQKNTCVHTHNFEFGREKFYTSVHIPKTKSTCNTIYYILWI